MFLWVMHLLFILFALNTSIHLYLDMSTDLSLSIHIHDIFMNVCTCNDLLVDPFVYIYIDIYICLFVRRNTCPVDLHKNKNKTFPPCALPCPWILTSQKTDFYCFHTLIRFDAKPIWTNLLNIYNFHKSHA